MKISCIVAVANNNVIGKDNDIPWYLPADLKYFKKTTLNHHILMGRNCYQSIGKPLPKRTNVIISRNPYFIASNCLIAHTIDEALALAYNNGEEEAIIIGGGTIYDQTKDLWDKLYLTEVDLAVKGDVFFPDINLEQWTLISEEPHQSDDKNKFSYTFKVYEKNHST